MEEIVVKAILDFTNSCAENFTGNSYNVDYIKLAKSYLKVLKSDDNRKNAIYRALIDKLDIIIEQTYFYYSNNFNLMDDRNNLSRYIICLIKEKHLTDSKLIARCAYIELSKHLYYDISYTKATELEVKRIIVDTPIDPKTAKIFSYVVCTQWLQLYKYILSYFGIFVKEMRRPLEDHTWGEVELNNGEIIIVDATDYICSSIDLSNAKSISPTTGFLILPMTYSGIKLQEIYSDKKFKNVLEAITKYYTANRELDISLGYIADDTYPVEKVLGENELFSRNHEMIPNLKEADRFMEKVQEFMVNLPIPNNMDGYEVFAYYHKFIEKLPINIRGNISMKTLYVDTFEYKQSKLRKKYLQVDEEYFKYLNELVYRRYYKYLSGNGESEIFSLVQKGVISTEQLGSEILRQELKVAEINRRLNPYYAINELVIYNPFHSDCHDLYQLYEPTMGRKVFDSLEKVMSYKKTEKVL